MSNIEQSNITVIDKDYLSQGQRVVKIGDLVFPVGVEKNLSFVTAEARDIRFGKVGADWNGDRIDGAMIVPEEGGDLSALTVTNFTPAKPACTGLSQIVVSGMSDIGSEEDGDFVAYSAANGTYLVTPETERIENPFGRIYKHESKEWYIWGNYDSEYEEGYWHISQSTDSSGVTYMTGNEQLSSGTFTFEDWDWGASFEITLAVTETSYPDTPVVLEGTTDSGSSVSLTGYDAIPQVGRKYVYSGDSLIGRALDAGNGVMPNEIKLLTHWGLLGGQGDSDGRIVTDEVGNCEMRRNDNTDITTHTNSTSSLFGSNMMFFKDFSSEGGSILIKKLSLLDAFTVEFWGFATTTREDLWGGYVMVNRTKWDESGDQDEATVIRASTNTSHATLKEWRHQAFTHAARSSTINEWYNGILVAEHAFTLSLGGSDDFLFTPGSREGGRGSHKYVAQLAIWGRALSDAEIANIVEYKQPYHL